MQKNFKTAAIAVSVCVCRLLWDQWCLLLAASSPRDAMLARY